MSNSSNQGSLAVVVDTIEAQRRRVREASSAAIRVMEEERDEELGRLERAAAILGGGLVAPAGPSSAGRAGSSPRRRRKRPRHATTPEAVGERCEAVFRHLVEAGTAVAKGRMSEALNLTPHATRTALERLVAEHRVARIGTGAATRYRANADGVATGGTVSPLSPVPGSGSIAGRLLATIQDRGSATPDELALAVGSSPDRVRQECGALIREGEVRMSRRDGRPVYVAQAVA
jgi:hypothetical protein